MNLCAGLFVSLGLACVAVAVWRHGRAIRGLSAQLAVLTLVTHDVREQLIALTLTIKKDPPADA